MTFVTGDTGSVLEVTCRDNDSNAVINLTGATVELRWLDAAGTLVNRAMTVITPTGGLVQYRFVAAELFSKQMKFEVRITDSSGRLLRSISLLREDVREALS